jgi:ELWxxDGT repeat protein/VCBS repeat-containing protein
MPVPRWLRPLAARPDRAPARRAPRRPAFRPRVERLEDRTTPSAVQLTDPATLSPAAGLTAIGSHVYFVANSAAELWRTDGTPGGAIQVDTGEKPVLLSWAESSSSPRSEMTAADQWLYFFTDNGDGSYTLRRTNESMGGASDALKTFDSEPEDSPSGGMVSAAPYGLTAFGQDVYYVAHDPAVGYELHRTAGATGATTVYDLAPGPVSSWPTLPQGTDTYVYVSASDAGGDLRLFGIDARSPAPAAREVPSPTQGTPYLPIGNLWGPVGALPTAVGPDLYFYDAPFSINSGLWRLTSPDDPPQYISTVGSVYGSSSGYHFPITAANGALYFAGRSTTSNRGYSLWRVEGSTPTLLQDFPYTGGTASGGLDWLYPVQIAVVGSDVYFSDRYSANNSGPGTPSRLWKWSTNGSAGPAELIMSQSGTQVPLYIAPTQLGFSSLTPVGSSLYFQLDDDQTQSQLTYGVEGWWQTTGTAAGTQRVTPPGLVVASEDILQPLLAGPFGPTPSTTAVVGTTLFFLGAYHGPYDGSYDLWRLNAAPTAADFAATAQQDTPTSLALLTHVTDADTVDLPHLSATVVSGPAHGSLTLNADGSYTYTPTAGYVGPDSFTYQASDGIDPSNVATVSVNVQSLQAALNGLGAGGTLNVQTPTPEHAHDLIAAANALDPATTPTSTLVVDLSNQTIQDTIVNVPPQVTVQFVNGTFIGGSPALVVSSGVVIVRNSVFLNSTDAPAILVTGGRLVLRNDTIQESTGYGDPAIAVTGTGTVDLGTASSPGGNTININGAGAFAQNTTATPIAAVSDTFTVNGLPLTPSTLSGTVFEDFNGNGQIDFGENGIANVLITLAGTDDLGNAVSQSQRTDSDGAYVFLNLRPGSYTITETQPAGFAQGIDSVGTAGGSLAATDQFSVPLGVEVNGENYNFGEQPSGTGPLNKGQTAGIGFWNNKNGQALILALNGGPSSHQLGDWLAATLPNTFGANAGSNDLAGKTNASVAALFQSDFVVKGVKLDAQVLATALAVYATNATLDPTQVAANYGFIVSGDGVGAATWNVGTAGDAFGVANNTTMTVMDLLLATDDQAINGLLYNNNATKRHEANAVYSALNQAGSIS